MKPNPTDILKMDVPLFIRLLEYAREEAKTDMQLHSVTERMVKLCQKIPSLSMSNYPDIVNMPAKEEIAELKRLLR